MSQGVNTQEDSLLFGNEARRQQLYPDSSNYDTMNASAPSAQPGAQDNSSGSGNAIAMEVAPPPPSMATHPSVQAGVDHWTTMNPGVQNLDGSLSVDTGFDMLNQQYTGNVPQSPMSGMNGQRSATSMEWEQVATPAVAPVNGV